MIKLVFAGYCENCEFADVHVEPVRVRLDGEPPWVASCRHERACERTLSLQAAAKKKTAYDPDEGIENLELSVRSYNCLSRANITTLGALANTDMETLTKVRNLGRRSVEEVITRAREHGIEIKYKQEETT